MHHSGPFASSRFKRFHILILLFFVPFSSTLAYGSSIQGESATLQSQSGYSVQEVLKIPADGSVVESSNVFDVGSTYTLRVSGILIASSIYFSDAEYAFNRSVTSTLDACPSPVVDIGVGIDDNDVKTTSWGELNGSHVYTTIYEGKGHSLKARFFDCNYPDNFGMLTLEILKASNDTPILETLDIPTNGNQITSSISLDPAYAYRIKVIGTMIIGSEPPSGIGTIADAEYAVNAEGESFDQCRPIDGNTDLGIAINDNTIDTVKPPKWGPYNQYHLYEISLFGYNTPISLSYHDCAYSDNSGSLRIEISRIGSAQRIFLPYIQK